MMMRLLQSKRLPSHLSVELITLAVVSLDYTNGCAFRPLFWRVAVIAELCFQLMYLFV
jgi:hypothetical protein